MLIENAELLRLWLTVNLRTLTEADPAALGKYVLALIKKDKPDDELRQGMLDQLDVFLQQQTIPFVDRLFHAINTREYLKTEHPSDGTIYMLNKGKDGEPIVIPYHELPNPFNTTTSSSGSSRGTDERGESVEMKSCSDPSLTSMDVSTESDALNTSHESNRSDESEIVSSDPNYKNLVKSSSSSRTTNGSNNSSASRKDKLEKDRLPRRKSRSPYRPRGEHGRRSWSPKDHARAAGRHRPTKRSPGRRIEREGFERRRSPRNRSSSPYDRTRSPHRYGSSRRYEPKRVRSPLLPRDRSRSPLRNNKIDGMDTKSGSAIVSTSPDQRSRNDNGIVQKTSDYPNGNRCKDFDEKGLCMRGELCPFDHGQNPVVLQDVGGVGGIKRSVQLEPEPDHNILPYRGIDHPEFRLVRPTNRPLIPNLDSDVHNTSSMPWGHLPPFHGGSDPRMRGGLMMRPPMFPFPPRELINVPVIGPPGSQIMDEGMGFPPLHHMGLLYPQQRGGHGGRGRGRGRGGMFDHSRLGGKTKIYTNCSLEVKRIPSSQNTISDLNSHFVQFGKIVNIQINFEDDPEAALITFSSPHEANAAYKSTEAVLNNRFIRVFWHNKEKENEDEDGVIFIPRVSAKERLGNVDFIDEEMDSENERILVSGANVTKTVYNSNPQKREFSQEKVQAVEAIKKSQEQLAAQEQLKRAQEEKKRETMKLMHDLQKKKQVMLIEQIEQQKKLIHKLENSKSMKPEEKEELMKLIKTLQESIEAIKKGMEVTTHHQNRTKPQALHSQTQAPQPNQPLPGAARDILDAELDLYNTELEGGDTHALKQKVAELRSQARVAGVYGRGRGGFHGSPPARGAYKATRVGNVSRSVDHRTTTLFISGFPATILPELMAHFAQFGLVPYHKPDYNEPSLIMTYENRKCAETAFAKGRVYKDYNLEIKWVPNSPQKEEFKNGSPPAPEEMEVREEYEV